MARLPQHSGSLLVAIEGGVGPATPLPPPVLQPGASPDEQQAARQQGGEAQPPAAPHQQELECFAWVVVQSPCGAATSHARSASFPLPPALSELMLRDGLELGDADDKVFGRCGWGRGYQEGGASVSGDGIKQEGCRSGARHAANPLLRPLRPTLAGSSLAAALARSAS